MKKLLLALAFVLFFPLVSFASPDDNVFGFAWSHNTGWIQMNNCTHSNYKYPNTGQAKGPGSATGLANLQCGSVSYGVTITSTGDLVGHGWSPNVGWIKFGQTSCGPSPKVNFASNGSGTLSGWAQVVSGTSLNTGGWNGCIRLSGPISAGGNHGVTIEAQNPSYPFQQFSGYAWSANTAITPAGTAQAVGDSWVNFSGVYMINDTFASYVDLSVDEWSTQCTPTNNRVRLTWETSNIVPNSCQWTSGVTGATTDIGNAVQFNLGSLQQNYVVGIQCNALGGGVVSDSISVSCEQEPLTVQLVANPTSRTTPGTTMLTWTSTGATVCTATQGPGFSTGGQVNGTDTSSILTGNQDFTILCRNNAGDYVSDSVTVTVDTSVPPNPHVSLKCPSGPVPLGSGYQVQVTTSNIRPAANGLVQCTVSTDPQSSGSLWTGPLVGNTINQPAANLYSITNPPVGTHTHKVTCYGNANAAIQSVDAECSAIVEDDGGGITLDLTLTANPTSLSAPGTTTLTWSSTNANSCVALAGPGFATNGQTSGSDVSAVLTGSHTFTVRCNGAVGSSATRSVTVSVSPNSNPYVNLSGPNYVSAGTSYTMNWTTRRIRPASAGTQCSVTTTPVNIWGGAVVGNTTATLQTNSHTIANPAQGIYKHDIKCYGTSATNNEVTDSHTVYVGGSCLGPNPPPSCTPCVGNDCPKIIPRYLER